MLIRRYSLLINLPILEKKNGYIVKRNWGESVYNRLPSWNIDTILMGPTTEFKLQIIRYRTYGNLVHSLHTEVY